MKGWQLDDALINERLRMELDEAEQKAIDALSRYKFQMFGYWAAIWVHLNRISGAKRSSPFAEFVVAAKHKRQSDRIKAQLEKEEIGQGEC